ncbi:acetyl-CoA decarbonylase/synthase complex subunit gamma [Thermoflexales bacterium]|nr:acetyl-CoA decarbonylase/synthase complex subunit gamma [Thermoflexales bacterium]
MALSGIQIYKLLPQTNCKECGFPTCLAFAMKLAAKQVELSACPYVSDASKAQLAESAAPPMRLVTLKSNGHEIKVGNEVVLFRHEKTFYNRPGIFIKVRDDEDIQAKVEPAEKFAVSYVGMDLTVDGFAVEATGDPDRFVAAIKTLRQISQRPLVLISSDAKVMAAGLAVLNGETPLICGADANNWEAMADLAKANTPGGPPPHSGGHGQAALVVKADSIEALADLTEKIKGKGVEDLVIDPATKNLSRLLTFSTQVRRLALKKNVRSVGFPIMVFANDSILAAQAVAKYGGFIVLDEFKPETVYPLLVLRQNIYTDPQKPIQVQPGLYEINNPKPESPVLVTTNFSITYFSVANEVESSGLPAWLLVTDAEGMSVLTAWAAGKFDAERIAKAVKTFNVADKVSKKRVVLPGHVAVLSGELEAELTEWEIKVGPREAVDLPAYYKQVLV